MKLETLTIEKLSPQEMNPLIGGQGGVHKPCVSAVDSTFTTGIDVDTANSDYDED